MLYLIGRIMADPIAGVGAFDVALLLTALMVLVLFAWEIPQLSRYSLLIATPCVILIVAYSAIAQDRSFMFEYTHGPVISAALVAVELPIGIHGYFRDTRVASYTLMYLGIVPLVLRAVSEGDYAMNHVHHMFISSGYLPSIFVGALLLWSTKVKVLSTGDLQTSHELGNPNSSHHDSDQASDLLQLFHE